MAPDDTAHTGSGPTGGEAAVFDTPEPILAVVELYIGDVQVDASERGDTEVRVTPRNSASAADVRAAENTRVEYSHGKLLVQGPKDKLRTWLPTDPPSVDVSIAMPAGSRLQTELGHADLRGTGRLGESRLSTGHGGVDVEHVQGHLAVNVKHGAIRIQRIDGTATLRNRGGNVDLGEVAADLRVWSTYGDMALDRALGDVVAKTGYGGVRIGEVVRGSVVIDSAHGRTELGVREGTAAWLDITSRHGSVRSELSATGPPGPADEQVRIRIRSNYGDITLRRTPRHS